MKQKNMNYFFDEIEDEWEKAYFRRKLVDEKYYIELEAVDSYVCRFLYRPTLNKPDNELTPADGNSPQAHEATLQFILPLLQTGQLKMRRVIQPRDPEYPGKTLGITDNSGPVPIRTYPDAKEAIEDLRFVWRWWTEQGDPSMTEISTHFALPETPWQA